jgi:hypothetical protein
METGRNASFSSRAELLVLAGTIVTMVLSSVCVVVLCAAANEVSGAGAKVVHVARAASEPIDLQAPAKVVDAGVAVVDLR